MKYLVIAAVCLGTALARPDGAGGHHGAHHSGGHGHSAPAASAPATGYEQPASGYEQPASGYEAAATGYDQSGYDQSGYDQSGYSYPSATGGGYAPAEADSGIDLNMILIPILIIAGLSLLFPSVTSVSVDASKRRKRDAEDESSGNSVVERVQDIYMSVLESEECMERVACEVGGLAADAGLSPKMLSMATPFVPQKYSKMMKTFSTGKDCHKIKCGKIF